MTSFNGNPCHQSKKKTVKMVIFFIITKNFTMIVFKIIRARNCTRGFTVV